MTLLTESYCPAKGVGDIFISTQTNQLFYHSCLAITIKLYIEYMVGLYINILCRVDVLVILENYHPWDPNNT